jgi:hypothetical protein
MNYPKAIKAFYMRVNDDGRMAEGAIHPHPNPPRERGGLG